MSVHVLLGETDANKFEDNRASSTTYSYNVGPGGTLVVIRDDDDGQVVERVYGPTAWHSVTGESHNESSLTLYGQ